MNVCFWIFIINEKKLGNVAFNEWFLVLFEFFFLDVGLL